jgi:hypothetical protein
MRKVWNAWSIAISLADLLESDISVDAPKQ